MAQDLKKKNFQSTVSMYNIFNMRQKTEDSVIVLLDDNQHICVLLWVNIQEKHSEHKTENWRFCDHDTWWQTLDVTHLCVVLGEHSSKTQWFMCSHTGRCCWSEAQSSKEFHLNFITNIDASSDHGELKHMTITPGSSTVVYYKSDDRVDCGCEEMLDWKNMNCFTCA